MKLIAIIFSLSGLLLLIISIYGYLKSRSIILSVIYKEMEIKNNTDTFKLWQNIPVPVYNRFYFFNITNHKEITNNGSKPILQEIGPFTYRLHMNKTNVKIFNENNTINFYIKKTWFFERELSIGPESMQIITINSPLAAALSFLQKAPFGVKELITFTLDQITEGFFIKRNISQLMFEGYKDPITTIGPLIDNKLKKLKGKFGYFTMYNQSKDGPYNIYNGNDITKLTLINSYKNLNNLNIWTSEKCNRINDSTIGEMIPPINKYKNKMKLFNSLICRTLQLNYEQMIKDKHGLHLRRFVLDENVFKNSTEYPPNSCYDDSKLDQRKQRSQENKNFFGLLTNIFSSNVDQQQRNYITPSGVVDLGKCQFGAPVFLSSPHFLNADPYYASKLIGLRPNHSLHEFFVDVEPNSGIIANIGARIQMNVHINRPAGFSKFNKVPEIFFPVLWQDLTFEWTDDILLRIKVANHLPDLAPKIFIYLLSPLSVIIILSFILFPAPKEELTFNVDDNNNNNQEIEIAKSAIKDEKAKITFRGNEFVYQNPVDISDEQVIKKKEKF